MENERQNQNAEQDIGTLLKVRRDKLSELQAEGRDPFQITKYNRTHKSADIINGYTTEEMKMQK